MGASPSTPEPDPSPTWLVARQYVLQMYGLIDRIDPLQAERRRLEAEPVPSPAQRELLHLVLTELGAIRRTAMETKLLVLALPTDRLDTRGVKYVDRALSNVQTVMTLSQ